ncbi:SirB2 family protein [Halomonas sp. MCCC 1A17488]|uniref:SirB2 family protein n=1 Tax=Billgrantia sulfidoxydans TaxID=2733484 RepID=A0ABX7WBM3_9GAMM|nr:SirB2 family protein [Halomonas sp. MCCC 1A17488]MCG3240340.1 SirB2 family protein [Halomonas sp. MCCC 1A17488]QTP56932.1 SirB2 family protein [Halomonas sulfidoxydans]
MEHYALIKHLHMTTAVLSITFFLVRAWWSVREVTLLQRRWVRILPHVNDTLLLVLGLTLMVMLSLWPQQHPWLAAKLLALLGYILLGTVAIKRGRTPMTRGLAALAAVVVFCYMLGAAVTKEALFFLPN